MIVFKAYIKGQVVLESYAPADIDQEAYDRMVDGFTKAAKAIGADDISIN